MAREAAIQRNPPARMGVPDTSHHPQRHSSELLWASGGLFRRMTPPCSSALVSLGTVVSHPHASELFIQVCVSSHTHTGGSDPGLAHTGDECRQVPSQGARAKEKSSKEPKVNGFFFLFMNRLVERSSFA